MQNKIYSITEASEELNLENHTLRYYEDELKLSIPRNSLGHRYYREYDMKVFRDIIALKEQGLQLKAIRDAVQAYYDPEEAEGWEQSGEACLEVAASLEDPVKMRAFDITDTSNTKVEQFRLMMKETFVQAIYENEDELKSELNHHIKYKIEEDMKEEIQRIQNIYEEKDRERYKKLDETMREMQKLRSEMKEKTKEKKQKRSFFGKIFGKKSVTTYPEESISEE